MRENSKTLTAIFRNNPESLHQKGVNRLKLDSGCLFSAGRDGIVNQYSLSDCLLTKSYKNHIHWVNDLEISESLIFSASSDSRILMWRRDSENSKPLNSIFAHRDYIYSIKFVGSNLISAGEDGRLMRTDLDSKSTELFSSQYSIWSIDCSQNLIGLALSFKVTDKKTAKILDFRNPKSELELKGHSNLVRKILIRPDEKVALTCSSDSSVKLWDIGTRKVIETYSMHSSSVFALSSYWDQEYL